ncbi:hypothetical protein LguiA_019494 [Lonicera macranthoides]
MGFLNDTGGEMDSWIPKWQCTSMMGTTVATIGVQGLAFLLLAVMCNFLHLLLRPLSQPRIIANMIVGISISNLPFVRQYFNNKVKENLGYIAEFTAICHMFILGLEIDPKIIFQLPIREAKIATSGVLTTLIVAFLANSHLKISTTMSGLKFDLCLSILLSGTASPLLSRLITDLKISKSDIGNFVVLAGAISDVFTTLLLSIGFTLFDPTKDYKIRPTNLIIRMIAMVVIQAAISSKLTPILFNWVNHENPQGKTMKGPYLVISFGFVVAVCVLSPSAGYFDKILSSFLAGLFMPREGRIAKMMISKFNYLFGMFFYPLFFFWVGAEAELTQFEAGHLATWGNMLFLFLIITVGKVVGTVASGVMLGFHWPESVAIGLLLSVKGHFHIYIAIIAAINRQITISTTIVMIFVTLLSIIYTPLVVQNIIKRARKRSPTQKMALQWLNAANELRILLCIHGPQNSKSAINFMEISRGPTDPGILVYVTDMIELTDKITATMARGQGSEGVTVTDPEVVRMREEVTSAVKCYLEEDREGISVRRMMALSTLNNMHQDICMLAEDLLASLIILPFHKDQEDDGSLAVAKAGFRNVNRKILRHAPCSVGILVDRGLGSTKKVTRSSVCLNAAIIFIGGTDDREALAYAGRVARHPGVKLTIIRFILDNNADSVSSRINKARANTTEHEEELKLDDEYFAEFYDRHVASGHVAYMEKYLANSGQTFATIRSLEGQYDLFIVGRGGRVNTALTAGMNDWEECPELGPIGDILSSSPSATASVLIIQQHSLRGGLRGLNEEFTIM